MGIMESSSWESRWKGYWYFKENRVSNLRRTEPGFYSATVQGNGPEPYTVVLCLKHPRTSACNCPHANGRRVICKHLVATYFAAFPDEAERFYQSTMEAEQEARQHAEDLEARVADQIRKMKKSELQEMLLNILLEGPDWQYERFLAEFGLDDDL